nr:hypothetical protein CFP56_46734 [Quercus suber]
MMVSKDESDANGESLVEGGESTACMKREAGTLTRDSFIPLALHAFCHGPVSTRDYERQCVLSLVRVRAVSSQNTFVLRGVFLHDVVFAMASCPLAWAMQDGRAQWGSKQCRHG